MKKVILMRLIPFSLLAVYAALSLGTILQKSATWDETHYLGIGRYLISHHQWDIPSARLHPPLSYYIHSLPLFICSLDESCFERGRITDILSGVRRGQCLMKNSDPSGDRLLFLARLPMIGIGVLLGWFVFAWASALYGTGGGLMGLFLYCLSPNMLAHTGLITPDLCLTTFGFITVYFMWRNFRSPCAMNVFLCGISLGLTLLSKHAGLLWIPILALLALLEAARLKRCGNFEKGSVGAGPIANLGVVVLVAFFVLLLGYQFDLPAYFLGFEEQRKIVGGGFPAFLNGQISRSGGWWYYYLFGFLIKVPLTTLILLSVSLVMLWKGGFMERSVILWLGVPVVVIFAAFSFMTQVNIGLRYVLPAFPFLFVLSGRASGAARKMTHAGVFFLILLLGWYAFENGSVYTHYLSYFNQIAGGPKNGYRYLVDSNLDWGQDLKTLRKYMDDNGVDRIKLSYFGSADPAQYGIDYEALPSLVRLSGGRPATVLRKGDLVAVSATNLYPLYVDLGNLGEYLRSTSPVAHVGSILIYRLEKDVKWGA